MKAKPGKKDTDDIRDFGPWRASVAVELIDHEMEDMALIGL